MVIHPLPKSKIEEGDFSPNKLKPTSPMFYMCIGFHVTDISANKTC